MDSPSEHKTARMRHLREDDEFSFCSDSLVFPRRPTEPVSLDVDSARHSRVFSEDIMSGIKDSDDVRASQAKSRWMLIAAVVCFLFLLATVSFYSVINEENNLDIRDMESKTENVYEFGIDDDSIKEKEIPSEDMAAATSKSRLLGWLDYVLPGHVTEGGDMINTPGLTEDELLNTDREIDGELTDNVASDFVLDTNSDDIDDAALEKTKKAFIMDINGERFEVTFDEFGDMVLPEDISLNPHVRHHWELIRSVLGMDYYEDNLEPSEELLSEGISEEYEMKNTEAKAVRMPEGLLFEAPAATGEEHVHTEDCDPVSVDIADDPLDENADGDAKIETVKEP